LTAVGAVESGSRFCFLNHSLLLTPICSVFTHIRVVVDLSPVPHLTRRAGSREEENDRIILVSLEPLIGIDEKRHMAL
jgi:hypothetical protein